MTNYTAEQIEAFIAENESHTYMREDFDILASLDILHEFADLLRERESAPVVPDAPVVTLSRSDIDAWDLPESWTGKRVQLVEAKP